VEVAKLFAKHECITEVIDVHMDCIYL